MTTETNGRLFITIDIGANQLFSTEAVNTFAGDRGPNEVILVQLEVPLETPLRALKDGYDAGAIIILNPTPAHDLLEPDLLAVDILTHNETALRVCLGMSPCDYADEVDLFRTLLKRNCRMVLVTGAVCETESYSAPRIGRSDGYPAPPIIG